MSKIVGLWLLALCVLLSCTLPQGSTVPPEIAYGTDAVEIEFKPLSDTLYMCKETELIMSLTNKGTTDIENGVFTYILEDQVLKTVGPGRFGTFELQGRSQYNPQGETAQDSLKVKNNGLPPQLETYSTPIIFSACYEYQTLASAPVCIDPDTLGKNPNKPCAVQDISVGGQGAPVAITRIEPVMTPAGSEIRPTFIIYVQNLGSGRVIQQDAIEDACGTTTVALTPQVDVDARLQDMPLTCKQATIRLEAGKESRIVCETQNTYSAAQGTFTGILTVQLDYGYVNTASHQLTIQKLPNQGNDCT